jgi:hypothetical protein
MHFKVIFHLDGCGIYYGPENMIHLDSLLTWALYPMQVKMCDLGRDDKPEDIKIPLLESTVNGSKVWHASALFLDGPGFETLRFWRKRFDQDAMENINGNPNIKKGVYREYNVPVPLLLVPRMIAYASGDRKEVKKILSKNIKGLGKKWSYGYGRVLDIECEKTSEDFSHVKDGMTMRYLPHPDGTKLVRSKPPYWNSVDQVKCLEIGAKFNGGKQ